MKQLVYTCLGLLESCDLRKDNKKEQCTNKNYPIDNYRLHFAEQRLLLNYSPVSLAFLVCVLLDKIELLAVMTGRFDL